MASPPSNFPKPLPASELIGRRFTVRCALCARCRVFTHDEFMAWARPRHRDEFVDEIEKRVRCAPSRETGRACAVKITYELKLS